jgi:hypothetical protein
VLKFLKVILSLAFLFIPVDWWRILHKWLKSLANLTFRFYIGTPALCFLISASISKSFNMNHFYVSYDFYVFIRVGVSCNSLPECVRSCFAYIVGFSPLKHPQSVFLELNLEKIIRWKQRRECLRNACKSSAESCVPLRLFSYLQKPQITLIDPTLDRTLTLNSFFNGCEEASAFSLVCMQNCEFQMYRFVIWRYLATCKKCSSDKSEKCFHANRCWQLPE